MRLEALNPRHQHDYCTDADKPECVWVHPASSRQGVPSRRFAMPFRRFEVFFKSCKIRPKGAQKAWQNAFVDDHQFRAGQTKTQFVLLMFMYASSTVPNIHS